MAEVTTVWTQDSSTSANDQSREVTVDANSNAYVTGRTDGNLDGQTNSGNGDIFLTKYASDGTKQWTGLTGASNAQETASSVSIGTDGNINVYGYSIRQSGTNVTIDGQTYNAQGSYLRTTYATDGTKVGTLLLDSTNLPVNGSHIKSDASGNIYAYGSTESAFDGQSYSGSRDAFVVKYDNTGAKQWSRIFGSSQLDSANDISFGSDGSIYISGLTQGLSFQGENNNGAAFLTADVFLMKLNDSGTLQWTRLIGTSTDETGGRVSVASDGSIYLEGTTRGNIDGITNPTNDDTFISRFSSAGAKQWTRLLGYSDSSDTVTRIQSAESGSVIIGGPDKIQKYDSAGNRTWISSLNANEYSTGIATLSSSVWLAGNKNIPLTGDINFFLRRYNETTSTPGGGGGGGGGGGSSSTTPTTTPAATPATASTSPTTTPATTPAASVTPTPSAESPALGIPPQASVQTVQLSTPVTFGSLAVSQAVVGTNQNDSIIGSDAAEALTGGLGRDQIRGGKGPDAFVFETAGEFGKRNYDTITDFNPAEGDKVVISTESFTGITLIAFQSVNGKKAVKAASKGKSNLIYDSKSGMLYFDSNGKKNGWGDGGEFAKLLGAPDITKTDFVLI